MLFHHTPNPALLREPPTPGFHSVEERLQLALSCSGAPPPASEQTAQLLCSVPAELP